MRTPSRRRDLSWTTGWQATRLILSGATAHVAITVALVVGTILSLANQGSALVDGTATWVTWARVLVNYVVPYVVSSIGYLAPFRVRPAADDASRTEASEE
jgi:ABC-type Fe3+ transport system permease subunit